MEGHHCVCGWAGEIRGEWKPLYAVGFLFGMSNATKSVELMATGFGSSVSCSVVSWSVYGCGLKRFRKHRPCGGIHAKV